jgi:SPX domain protein involved in polyphosphate accumulation
MKSQQYFERYELKYLITPDQYHRLLEVMKDKMKADEYGKSTVLNIYYDTPNYLLVRRSIEKPVYKEKLRLRTYSLPDDDASVFLELKKKYQNKVYKRRECMKYKTARDFLKSPEPFSQVTKEIAYFMDFYKDLYPAIFLSYDREAFLGISDSGFRITFDTNVLGRNENVSFESSVYGYAILPDDTILMEIKTATSIPLWLTSFLTKEKIFNISFSKYGNVYKILESNKKSGGVYHV